MSQRTWNMEETLTNTGRTYKLHPERPSPPGNRTQDLLAMRCEPLQPLPPWSLQPLLLLCITAMLRHFARAAIFRQNWLCLCAPKTLAITRLIHISHEGMLDENHFTPRRKTRLLRASHVSLLSAWHIAASSVPWAYF